ncbi:integrase [Bifidobacterium longum]|uniref:Integrase n=1 Tax=Bifidobacterium longum subsp. infantis TaxID=1682 RepID=A0A4S5B2D9_BIFLI|nr:integrase [Bifidobacterium longum]THJ25809.1 integrase [Bifidobacterium longum subsp. infantis]
MAKCGRKQRDKAVCLYITYERNAADAIRELGYPSRGALRMWCKDRLK